MILWIRRHYAAATPRYMSAMGSPRVWMTRGRLGWGAAAWLGPVRSPAPLPAHALATKAANISTAGVLALLMMHPRRVLSREFILDRVWGYDFGPASNSLEVYIGYLRRKTESGGEPRLIHTIRGTGYILRAD